MTDAPPVFDQLELPRSEVAVQAFAYISEHLDKYLLNHSIRGYVFARGLAQHRGLRPATDYDDEVVFLSCLLHDIGLSELGNGDQRFEVDGADAATTFLRGLGVDEARLEIIWDAIALHTSAGIANRKRLEVSLSHIGIGTDVVGLERENLPAGLADEVHAVLPRGDIGYRLPEAIAAQALTKPQKAIPMTLTGELVRDLLPYGALPKFHDMVDAAGWGDKPTSRSAHARPQAPEELAERFMEHLAGGDLDALVSLYEPSAEYSAAPGNTTAGASAIREAINALIHSGARLTLRPRAIRQIGDIALISNSALLEGASADGSPVSTDTTEVARRQPDGSWAYVIDDPFFGAHPQLAASG